MKKYVYFILAAVFLVVLSSIVYYRPATAQESTEEAEPIIYVEPEPAQVYDDPNPYVQQALLDFDQFVNESIFQSLVPGAAVAVVRDTSIIFLKGYGLRDVTLGDSIDIHSVFRLGSVSKSIAAGLTGALVGDHVLSWDDPVIKYLPDFRLKSEESSEQLTLRHVLSHTIGLPYHAYTNLVEEGVPLDTLLILLQDLDLVGEPGEVYSYQNVGFSLIGKVIEAATHKTFEEELTDEIFGPLQMKDASASYLGITSKENVAQPHLRAARSWVRKDISSTYYDVAPAGGINASISDMGLWLKALMGTRQDVLSDSTLSQIFEPQVKAISRNSYMRIWQRPRLSYYALGWRVITFKSDTLLYHGGYVNGYRSEVAIHPKSKIAICVLSNAPGSFADRSIPEFLSIYSHHLDSIAYWDNRKQYFVGR